MNVQPKSSDLSVKRKTAAISAGISLENALLSLRDKDEVKRFLLDLCTPVEISAFRERWRIAQLLVQGDTYRAAAKNTGASTATVTRVARFLQQERHQGYHLVLDRLHEKKR